MFKKLYGDDAGKTSFSVVAVIILMMSVFTSVYLAKISIQSRDLATKDRTLDDMVETIDNVHTEISNEAHILVAKILSEEIPGCSVRSLQDMNDALQKKFTEYIAENFNISDPHKISNSKSVYEMYVKTTPTIEVLPSIKNTKDITFETSSSAIESSWENNIGELPAKEESGTRSKTAVTNTTPEPENITDYANAAKLNTAIKGEFNETQKYAYLQINGMITYVIHDKVKDISIEKSVLIDKSVKSPLPLLLKTFGDFSENSKGDLTDIGRMVRYTLSTIAQYKVVQGYGSDKIKSDTDYRDILSEKDIEPAVNLALILEEGRYYRTFDYNAVEEFDNNVPGNTVHSSLRSLLDNYTTYGTVDPADIFALVNGLDKEPISASAILAQSTCTILDQYLLKFFDILSIPKEGDDGRSFVGEVLNLTGIEEEDVEFENVNVTTNMSESDNNVDVNYSVWSNYTENYSDENGSLRIINHEGWNKTSVSEFPTLSWWWCGNSSSGEYYNNSNRTLEFINVDLTDNRHLDNISESGAELTFSYYNQFEDDNDSGKVIIDDGHQQKEIQYASRMAENDDEVIDLADFMNKTISIKFNFVSNETGSDAGWFIRNIAVKKTFNGYNIDATTVKVLNDSADAIASISISENNFNITEKTWEGIITKNETNKIVGELKGNAENFLKELFSNIITYIVTGISSLINKDEPYLQINPKDNNSVMDDCRENVSQWAITGFNNIRSQLENPDEFARGAVELFANFVNDTFIAPITNFLKDKIDAFVEKSNETISSWKKFVEEKLNSGIIGRILSAVGDVLNIIMFGNFGYVADWVNGLLGNAQKIDWGGLFDKYVLKPIQNVLGKIVDIIKSGIAWLIEKIIAVIKPVLLYLINATETIVLKMINRTTDNGEINNLKFLQTMYVGTPVEFWDGNYTDAKENESIEYERFVVYQNPGYLSIENGGLNITLSEPQGTHHVYWDKVVEDPFVTQWNVSITGSVNISTRTERKLLFSDDYVWYNDTLNIDISFPIVVSSGWNLTGVHYADTTSLISSIINVAKEWVNAAVKAINDFIDNVLTTIAGPIKGFLEVVNQVIDGFQKIIDAASNFIATLIEKGMELIKIISIVFQKLVHLLQLFIKSFLSFVVDIIVSIADILLKPLLGGEFKLSLFGLTFTLFLANHTTLMNRTLETNEKLLSARVDCGLFGFGASVYRLNVTRRNESGSEYDILIDGNISISHFDMTINIDPLLLINERIVDARGKWEENGKGCTVNITLPEIEIIENSTEISTDNLLESTKGIPDIPIPPLGIKVHINIGVNISYNQKLNVSELIAEDIKELKNATNVSLLKVLEDIVSFVKKLIAKIMETINNIINKFLNYIEENVTKFTFFVDGRVKDVSGTAGGGFRLAFLIDNGSAIRVLLAWLISNIQTYFSNLLNPAAKAQYATLSQNVPEHMFVQCSFYFSAGVPEIAQKVGKTIKSEKLSNWPKESLSVVQLSLNIPFIVGVFTGKDLGQWKAYLGVYQENIPGNDVYQLFEGTTMEESVDKESAVNLWIVKVEVAEI